VRQIVLGKHSGRAAVRHALGALGIEADETCLRALLARVRAHASARKREVTPEELADLYRATLAAATEPENDLGGAA